MAHQLFQIPKQIPLGAGRIFAGAKAYFYATGTTTPQNTYSDSDLATPHANPVVADSEGVFAPIYLDPTLAYKLTLRTSADVLIYTVDPVNDQLLSQAIIGEYLFPPTETEIAASVTPSDYAYRPGNIRRYGAVVNGTTDDSAAIRKALDVAAQDGTTVTCDPPGKIKVGSTVYLPQHVLGFEGGYKISLPGCTLVGQGNGTGTIFETGTGHVSTGGATNFNETPETGTSLHIGEVIEGPRFIEYGTALRLFNFTQGCALRDVFGYDGKTLVYAKRCFYLALHNCVGRADTAITASDAVFNFDSENNVITLSACSAVANGGTAYRFDGAVKGLLMNNCAAEGSAIGIEFNGAIYGAGILGCYLEGNTTAIDLGDISKDGLTIDQNYFVLNTTDITGDNWQTGQLGPSNNFEDGAVVSLGGNGNFCRVYMPTAFYPDTGTGNHTGWTNTRTGWTLNESIDVVYNDFLYSAASGGQAILAKMAAHRSGSNLVSHKYTGHGGGLATNIIPFCTTSLQNADDDLRIDTLITYGSGASAMFDVQVSDGIGTYVVSGRIVFGNTVYQDDSTGKTVTASDNGGNLRINIAGFNNITQYAGSVRIV